MFMAKVCPKAVNFAIAETITQFLVLQPQPTIESPQRLLKSNISASMFAQCLKEKLSWYVDFVTFAGV